MFNQNTNPYPYNNPFEVPNVWGSNNWQAQPKTNKILVTSLDEAIAKTNDRNSEIYYWDQSKPVIYVVRMDFNGVKSWAQLPYSLPNQEGNTPATKADLVSLTAAVESLVKRIESFELSKQPNKKKKIEVIDKEDLSSDESNG